ncbi:MAG: sulfur carrier protein ThiS [Gammaproteobacteria bacterium]|nr:sulfur carrier protein ThiS [Gammaproteobacteria bacterium]
MEIVINNETRQFEAALSIAELLARLEMADKRVAVEVNQAIVPKSRHGETWLRGGERVEIVHAIGGG